MPTEAEWEYACRATSLTTFSNGNCLSTDEANYCGDYPYKHCKKGSFAGMTLPVGSLLPNAWGLYDMHGNVREWCFDWYAEYTVWEENIIDPEGPGKGWGRVCRGGGWGYRAKMCRSAVRAYLNPDQFNNETGFRVVMDK